MSQITVATDHGFFCLTAADGAIVALTWGEAESEDPGDDTALLAAAADQLQAYFAGALRNFDLPLAPAGTDFNRSVWDEMSRIPYGEVRTYGQLAEAIGAETAQPVGAACGANPIPVIIPCHRVVAAGGQLGGYSGRGGLATKLRLLAHEGAKGIQGDLFLAAAAGP